MNVTRDILTFACYRGEGQGFFDKVLIANNKVYPLGQFPVYVDYVTRSLSSSATKARYRKHLRKFKIGLEGRILYMGDSFIFNENKKLIALQLNDYTVKVEFGYFTKANEVQFLHKLFYRSVIQYMQGVDDYYIDRINFNLKTLSAKKELEKQILEYVTSNQNSNR